MYLKKKKTVEKARAMFIANRFCACKSFGGETAIYSYALPRETWIIERLYYPYELKRKGRRNGFKNFKASPLQSVQ